MRQEKATAAFAGSLKDMGRPARRAWSAEVLGRLAEVGALAPGDVAEIHAGAEYRDFGLVDGLHRVGIQVEIPTQGMRIGEQLSFYARTT